MLLVMTYTARLLILGMKTGAFGRSVLFDCCKRFVCHGFAWKILNVLSGSLTS